MSGGVPSVSGVGAVPTRVADAVRVAPALQTGSMASRLVDVTAEVLGLALLAGGLAAAVALVYRWYTRERVPGGLPVLVGLSGVALYLNSTRALRQVIGNTGDPLDETVAVVNIVTVLVGVVAARAGTDIGDRVGADAFTATGDRVEGEVSRVVQAVGRVITVELPEEIDDIVGYDPVPDGTKEKLAGRSFVFPRRLTVSELRDRLVTRLKADYAVGHVDIDLAEDGTVEYLAVGSRAAGIGPTLPPETSAVAVRADPAFAASAGDLVQVWERNPPERVLTAELRGSAGDVVTLAVDAADTRRLDDDTEYRLVTLPVESRPDREFVSLLRAADETMAAVTVAEGSPLAGQPLGALDATVVAVRPAEGPVDPLPARDHSLAPGDTLYLVATPEAIRRIDVAVRAQAGANAPRDAEPAAGSEFPPDRRVDATTPVAGSPDESAGPVAGTPSGAPDRGTSVATSLEGDGTSRSGESPRSGDESPSGETAGVEDVASAADDGETETETALDLGEPDLATLDGGDESSGEDERDDRSDADSDAQAGTGENETGTDASDADEPTVEDLADLPGTDPDELVGTDLGDPEKEESAGDDPENEESDDGDGPEGTGESGEPGDGAGGSDESDGAGDDESARTGS